MMAKCVCYGNNIPSRPTERSRCSLLATISCMIVDILSVCAQNIHPFYIDGCIYFVHVGVIISEKQVALLRREDALEILVVVCLDIFNLRVRRRCRNDLPLYAR